MNWTRMADYLGGYFAVNTCYGVRIGVRVWRSTVNGPNPWIVQLDGVDVGARRTCAEAKAAAVEAVMRRRREIEARQRVAV